MSIIVMRQYDVWCVCVAFAFYIFKKNFKFSYFNKETTSSVKMI